MNTKLNHIKNWAECGQQANWSVTKLAKRCSVSVRTLERFFVKEMGESPKTWLLKQRQQQANELLQDGSSIKEMADCLSYKHPNHLTNAFKKHWGRSPTDKVVPLYASNS